MATLAAPEFTCPDKAREHLEALLWPQGPFCPHCGSFAATRLPPVHGRKTKAYPEGCIRKGVIQCNDCREQYSITVGTVFASSKVPLNKWLLANHLMVSSKKGMSAHQIHRMLGVTYKTAWFMAHRIRTAMAAGEPALMGTAGTMVEVDETYIGKAAVAVQSRTAIRNMNKVLTLVDRATGRSTSVVFEGTFTAASVAPILARHIAPEARLMTDGAHMYKTLGKGFADHQYVDHAKDEYVRRGQPEIHTNTIEGFFSIFKRGMKGIYQHCSSKHLHRYLAEFDFRYTNRIACGVNDSDRATLALQGAVGKRLMYRQTKLAA